MSSPTLKDPDFGSEEGPVTPRTPSSPPPPPAPPAVTLADIHAYLSRKETQHRLRNVVAGALRDRATRDLVGELSARAQMAILEGDARPESLETLPVWVDGACRNTVRERFKEDKEEREVFTDRPIVGEGDADGGGRAADAYDGGGDRDDVDGARARAGTQAADAVDATADAADESSEPTPDAFLVSSWLRARAKKDPEVRALLELLAYKAKSKKTYAAIADEQGTTVNAINLRVYRLRKKYEDEWRAYKRSRDAMLLVLAKWGKVAAVAILVAAAGLLIWLVTRSKDDVRPVDDFPPLVPAPTASATPPDIADPTQPSAVPEEDVLKPGQKPQQGGGKPPRKK